MILARAGLRFATKVHGSDLSYTVRPHPERFVPFAREGMEATAGALVGSRHTAEDLWKTVGLPGLEQRTRLGPPGVDVEAFRQLPPAEADVRAIRLAEALEGTAGGGGGGDAFARESGEAAEAVPVSPPDGPRVMTSASCWSTRGWTCCSRAGRWSTTTPRRPAADVGFGALGGAAAGRSGLEAGDIERGCRDRRAGRGLEGDDESRLRHAPDFSQPGAAAGGLRGGGPRRRRLGRVRRAPRARGGREPVLGVGTHSSCRAPSPRAGFGMVAAEAAAAGLCRYRRPLRHRRGLEPGFAPVCRRRLEASSRSARRAAVERSPPRQRLAGHGAGPSGSRERGRSEQRSPEQWSWESVARGVIAASQELGGSRAPEPLETVETADGSPTGIRPRESIECRAHDPKGTFSGLTAACSCCSVVISVSC